MAGGVFFVAKEYPSRTLPKKAILDFINPQQNYLNASETIESMIGRKMLTSKNTKNARRENDLSH